VQNDANRDLFFLKICITLTLIWIFFSFPCVSIVNVSRNTFDHSHGGAGIGNGMSDNQISSNGNKHGLESISSNCISPDGLIPSTTKCANPTVVHPSKTPNTTVVQANNCKNPTTVHANAPKNVIVHPATAECANPTVVHPSKTPNTTVNQPTIVQP
jgi:hypothetical protein